MRNGCHISNGLYLDSVCCNGTDRCLTAAAGSLDKYIYSLEAVGKGCLACGLCCYLSGIGSGLTGAAETEAACRCP